MRNFVFDKIPHILIKWKWEMGNGDAPQTKQV